MDHQVHGPFVPFMKVGAGLDILSKRTNKATSIPTNYYFKRLTFVWPHFPFT